MSGKVPRQFLDSGINFTFLLQNIIITQQCNGKELEHHAKDEYPQRTMAKTKNADTRVLTLKKAVNTYTELLPCTDRLCISAAGQEVSITSSHLTLPIFNQRGPATGLSETTRISQSLFVQHTQAMQQHLGPCTWF